jgi:hypothetical protein
MTTAGQPFLFIFGFESPSERLSNKSAGTDFESSWAFWLEAENADAALRWGRQIAEEFVGRLFAQSGASGHSWASGNFAHWICDDPAEMAEARGDTTIPAVRDRQMPDFSWALRHWSD